MINVLVLQWKNRQPEFNFTQESLNFTHGGQLGLEICIFLKILISNHMIGHHAVSLERWDVLLLFRHSAKSLNAQEERLATSS